MKYFRGQPRTLSIVYNVFDSVAGATAWLRRKFVNMPNRLETLIAGRIILNMYPSALRPLRVRSERLETLIAGRIILNMYPSALCPLRVRSERLEYRSSNPAGLQLEWGLSNSSLPAYPALYLGHQELT